MNTIVREMSPAGEIELTDAQLEAVYGAWDDDDCRPEPVICEARPVVWEARPLCQKQRKHSTTIIHKKVVFFYEEDFFIQKDDESSVSNSW